MSRTLAARLSRLEAQRDGAPWWRWLADPNNAATLWHAWVAPPAQQAAAVAAVPPPVWERMHGFLQSAMSRAQAPD